MSRGNIYTLKNIRKGEGERGRQGTNRGHLHANIYIII